MGLFDRFRSRDKPRNFYSGSGLGLAVVKELVEIIGGSIEVESEHKKGSTFTVTLPIKDNELETHDEDYVG